MSTETAVRRSHGAFVAVGAVLAALIVAVAWLAGLGIAWATPIGLVIAAGAMIYLYLGTGSTILRGIGAQPLRADEQPRLVNLVEGLCVANGFRRPALFLIDDAAPNMMMVGRHPRHGALAVTTGLLDRLDRVQLEGAIAHELTRMRERSVLPATTAAILIAKPLGFSASLVRSLSSRLLDPEVEVRTDIASVALTRYPPGLAAALESLRKDGREPARNPTAFRHLWFNPPSGAINSPHFSLEDRIDVLAEL